MFFQGSFLFVPELLSPQHPPLKYVKCFLQCHHIKVAVASVYHCSSVETVLHFCLSCQPLSSIIIFTGI